MQLPSITNDILSTVRLVAKELAIGTRDGSIRLANDYGIPALEAAEDLARQIISLIGEYLAKGACWVKNDLKPLIGKGVSRSAEALTPVVNRGIAEAVKLGQKAKGTTIGIHLISHSKAYQLGFLATAVVATVAYAKLHADAKHEEATKAAGS